MTPPDASRPLAGVRVIEVGYAMAGPLTARYLAHFGADVIRVESRRKPDSLRVSRASWLPAGTSRDVAQDTHQLLNLSSADKRSAVLEIDQPAGYDAFQSIVRSSDVVITNLSADAIPKLGLAYGDIAAIRPDIVYLATTAFGPEGPYRSFRTWGMNLCAISGLDAMVGWPDRDPTGMGMSFPDYPCALLAVTAIAAALQRRAKTGAGACLELPQFSAAINCVGPAVMDAALGGTAYAVRGNRSLDGAPQGVYPSLGSERWVAIGAADEAGWAALSAVAGLEHLATDPRWATAQGRIASHDELDHALAAWTAQRTDWAAAAELQEAGVAAAPVFDAWDVLADAHLASRSYFQIADSTRFGRDLVCRPGVVPDAMDATVRRAVPGMGEHTREVLRELAGLDEEAITALLADRAAYEMTADGGGQLARPYLSWIGHILRLPWPGSR